MKIVKRVIAVILLCLVIAAVCYMAYTCSRLPAAGTEITAEQTEITAEQEVADEQETKDN